MTWWSVLMDPNRKRGREKLDERLVPLRNNGGFMRPPKGWIKAIRESLGMSGKQLGQRLNIASQNVDLLEKSEAADTIKLGSLKRAAAALDCTLVYALVPNTSLESMVATRARAIALHDLGRAAHTMTLEAQATGIREMEARIESYIRDNVKERDLWKPS
jgi:predicted DNA-binding mobile mystery protein A